jgi:hypothetical protein
MTEAGASSAVSPVAFLPHHGQHADKAGVSAPALSTSAPCDAATASRTTFPEHMHVVSPAASPVTPLVGPNRASVDVVEAGTPPSHGHAAVRIEPPSEASAGFPGVDRVAEDLLTLSAMLQQFRQCLDDPLLSLPDPRIVHRWLFQVVPSSARRSRRIAAKGKGISVSAVKPAQRILMKKLGICHDEERLSASQL